VAVLALITILALVAVTPLIAIRVKTALLNIITLII